MGALLETKFHIPRGRQGVVARPRLSERLDRGWDAALTLVSAPAGFGKTTLVAQWLATSAAHGGSVAWLSLDHRDDDPSVFWTYLITAVHNVVNDVGAEALSLLKSTTPQMDAILSSLLNDLDSLSDDVVLVLDDYHLIDAADVHEGIAFLLDHIPPRIRLVIAGRADPALPLARLRSHRDLVEIRAADLRFTPDEAAAYLNDVMGLALTAADVAALDGRAEGWIAALQLAALSMQGREDVAAFIAGFAGDDRYIVDYLAEEVLNRQPEDVRQFLLETSVLDRLTGPLCDAVTGQIGGKAMLARLERGNLFLVALDDRRQWFRYHQLFADVLRAHLLDERPVTFSELHGRASGWYEQAGETFQAIYHALAAPDFGRAADLMERAIPAISRNRQEATVLRWLEVMPDAVVQSRPVLAVGFAGALLSCGRLEGVERRLQDAEQWLDVSVGTAPDTGGVAAGMVVVDDDQFRLLPGLIALYRSAHALAVGDVTGTVLHARQAVDLSAGDHLQLASASGLLGLASWTGGDLAAAHAAYTQCAAGLMRAGYVADTLGCAIALADICAVQGRLGDADRTFEQALHRAAAQDGSLLRGTADMYVGMSGIACERYDLASASRHLVRSQELGEHNGLPQNRYRWRVAMAAVRTAQGDLKGALELLDEAERFYVGDFFPDVRPVAAVRARIWILAGSWPQALDWARGRGLSAQDDLVYLREFEHITLARVLFAQSSADGTRSAVEEVATFLERLGIAAEQGGRFGSLLEILILRALCDHRLGNAAEAMTRLQRALHLAEPQGYVRMFVAEGAPMAALLRATADRGRTSAQVVGLLAAINTPTARTKAVVRGVIEPLSDRELEVLRLLGSDLNGPDIARRLFLSLNTVRTHTSNIYAKLGVNDRRAAVRRAGELDLMSRTPER